MMVTMALIVEQVISYGVNSLELGDDYGEFTTDQIIDLFLRFGNTSSEKLKRHGLCDWYDKPS